MNPLLEQLHDIDGLDAISRWPLALGWWIVIALLTLILIGSLALLLYWIAYKRSWRNDTCNKLNLLDKNLTEITARETLIILSEYIRRIAIKRYKRKECASLMGKAWLQWLARHDPKKFDWEKMGTLLIDAPFAPLNHPLPANQIRELIQAVKNWVR